MRAVPADEFLNWCGTKDIGLNPKRAAQWPRDLALLSPSITKSSWSIEDIHPRDWIAARLLEAIGPVPVFLWPRFPNLLDVLLSEDVPILTFFGRHFDPVLNTDGAIRFEPPDHEPLAVVLTILLTFGWQPIFDAFLVPEDGKYLIYIDHDDCLHGQFLSNVRKTSFERTLLPDGPIDSSPAALMS